MNVRDVQHVYDCDPEGYVLWLVADGHASSASLLSGALALLPPYKLRKLCELSNLLPHQVCELYDEDVEIA